MSLAKNILKDSFLYAAATAVSRGSQVVLLPLYFSSLSAGETGKVDIALGLALILSSFVSLDICRGMAVGMADATEQDRPRHTITASLFSLVLFGLLAILAFFGGWSERGLDAAGLGGELLVPFFALLVATQFQDLILNHYRWTLRARGFFCLMVLYSGVLIVASLAFVRMLAWRLPGAIWAVVCASLCVVIAGGAAEARKLWCPPSMSILRKMLKFSIPLVPSTVVITASAYMPRLTANLQLSGADLDTLTLVLKVTGILSPLFAAFAQSVVPRVLREHAEPSTPGEVARLFDQFTGISCVLIALVAVSGPLLSLLLSNGSRTNASAYLGIASTSVWCMQSYVFFLGAWITKKSWLLSLVSILAAITNIGLNLWAIPRFGVAGSLLSTLAASILSFWVGFDISQRLYSVPFRGSRLFVAALVLTLCSIIPFVLPTTIGFPLAVAGLSFVVPLFIFLAWLGMIPLPASWRKGFASV